MFAITNNSAARGNGDHARLGKTRVREARRRCREATARLQAMTDPTVMTGGLGPVAAAPVAVVQAAEAAEVEQINQPMGTEAQTEEMATGGPVIGSGQPSIFDLFAAPTGMAIDDVMPGSFDYARPAMTTMSALAVVVNSSGPVEYNWSGGEFDAYAVVGGYVWGAAAPIRASAQQHIAWLLIQVMLLLSLIQKVGWPKVKRAVELVGLGALWFLIANAYVFCTVWLIIPIFSTVWVLDRIGRARRSANRRREEEQVRGGVASRPR